MKNDIIAIICYCDTEEKLKVLVDNIILIREKYSMFKIAIQSNNPLPEYVQKMVDHYFYEDLNVFPENEYVLHWSYNGYFNKKFNYSYQDNGLCVFLQIAKVSKYLVEYDKVLLMNYDLNLEQIHIDNHINSKNDLLLYDWYNSVTLILMSFSPLIFLQKVYKFLNYESYISVKNITAEYRFLHFVKQSNIDYIISNVHFSDKINFDSIKDDCDNIFFTKNFICFNNNILEIYLWSFLVDKIDTIKINIDGNEYVLNNSNSNNNFVFEHLLQYDKQIYNNIKLIKIDSIDVDIILKIEKNGFTTI